MKHFSLSLSLSLSSLLSLSLFTHTHTTHKVPLHYNIMHLIGSQNLSCGVFLHKPLKHFLVTRWLPISMYMYIVLPLTSPIISELPI